MATPEEIRRAREATAFGGIFNNLFAANRRTANQLFSEGRRPVLGGLASKQRGVAGTDTLRFEGFAPFFGNLLDPIIKGVDAPRAASQSLIPQEDMIGEAFGTAGTVAAGTGAAAGRSILDYDPATTRIFAGKRAAARSGEDRRAAIAEAERLFEQGMKNRDVYDRTGVFRGADGKLRFEIDDKASSVLDVVHGGTSMRLEDYLTHPELYDLYPSMRGMPVDFKPRQDMLGVRGSFSPSSQRITLAMDDPEQMRSTLLHEAQHAVQDREGFSGGSSTQYDYSKKQASDFATNLLSSPEAKNMYYQSQSFDQQYNQIRPLYKAQYIDKLNNLVQKALDGRAKPSEVVRFGDWYKYGDTIRSNLGPMPNRAGPARDNWIASAAAQLRDFNLEEMSDLERSLYDEARRTFDSPREINNAVKRIERKIEKHRAGAFGYRELANRAREVQDLNVIDAYLREAGEVEARNVQSRANPNNPQGFPLDTAEFLPNKQIISNLRAGQNLVDVSSSSNKPLGIMVLEQQARGNKRLGGLLSKEPVMGTDTLRYEGIRPFIGNLLEPVIKGVDAPRAASQNLIPQEDMVGEALGTAGTAMLGGSAVVNPNILAANASKGTGAMTLWHGSPYDFNEFDLSKIGTGEGAQDLGRGFSLTDYEANAHLYTNPASRWGDLAAMERYRQAGPGRYYQVNVGAAPEQFLDWNKPWRDQVPEATPLYDALAKEEAVMLSQYADDPAMQAAIPRGNVSNMWRDNSGLEDAALQSGFVGNSRRNYSGDTEYTVFDPSLLRIEQKFDANGNVVSANASKPVGLLVLEQQARGNKRLGGLLESQGMDISDLSTASPAKIQSALDTAVKRGILDPRSAAGLKRGILDGL